MTLKNKTTITAVPGSQELFITREFDAPRELVFRAFMDPDILVQWLGPHRLTTTIDIFEPRSGGEWRYIQSDKEGNEYKFHGVFHDVTAPERVIQTFEFEGLPESGHVTLQTLKLEELPGGRTKIMTQSVFQSVEDRDGMIQSGMEGGVNDGFERLEKLFAQR